MSGLRHDPALAGVVARAGATLILGHLRGEPATHAGAARTSTTCCARWATSWRLRWRRRRRRACPRDRLAVDPGLGFGKRLADNLALLAELGALRERLGLPLLVGPSRKSFLGALTGEPAAERDRATLAACAVAAFLGADAVRVHDVAGAVRAVAGGPRAARCAPGGPVVIERLWQLLLELWGYLGASFDPVRDTLDIVLVTLGIYWLLLLIRGTRAVQILLGLIVLIVA